MKQGVNIGCPLVAINKLVLLIINVDTREIGLLKKHIEPPGGIGPHFDNIGVTADAVPVIKGSHGIMAEGRDHHNFGALELIYIIYYGFRLVLAMLAVHAEKKKHDGVILLEILVHEQLSGRHADRE